MRKRIVCLLLAMLTAVSIFVPAFAEEASVGTVSEASASAETKNALPAPVLKGASVAASGVTVTWGAVKGAAKYRVFYKTTSGWKKAGDTTKTSYTVTGLKSGTKYAFTVRCLSANGRSYTSAYDTAGRSVTWLAAPTVKGTSVAASGVTVTWGAVKGAAKYRVFYKTTGGWKKAGDTAGTSYTVTGLKSGTKYAFTVRCLSADGRSYTSAYDTAGKSVTWLAAPTVKSTAAAAKGVTVTWGAVKNAAKYRVFYKTGSGSWKKAGDTAGTSYTVTGLKSGTKYTFTVRCLSADGKSYASVYDTVGKSVTWLAAPVLKGATVAASGVTVTWGAVKGAAKYRVFYKTTGGWTKAGDTAGTSYTVTGLKSGTKYAFTVRCLSDDRKSFTSAYDTVGKSLSCLAAPTVKSAANAADGVTVTWGAVKNAAKYRVFYKTGSGSWTKAGDTAGTSYTVTGLKSGTKYAFTVRCLSDDGKSYASVYDTVGKSVTWLAAPTVKLVNISNGMKASWSKVSGASKYKVYFRAKGSGGWNLLGTTSSTSYTWSEAVLGMSYAFTVRAVGKDATGAYVSSGYVKYTGAAASPTDA